MSLYNRAALGWPSSPFILPPGPYQINRFHPLARGLVICAVPGVMRSPIGTVGFDGIDLTGNAKSWTTQSGAAVAGSPYGFGHIQSANNPSLVCLTAPPVVKNTTVSFASFVVRMVAESATNSGGFAVGNYDANVAPYTRYGSYFKNSASRRLHGAWNSSGAAFQEADTGFTPTIGVPFSLMGTLDSASQKFYVNGRLVTTSNLGFNPAYAANDTVVFGNPENENVYSGCLTLIGLVWDRVLGDAEVLAWSQDPFGLLVPDMDGVWFTAPSGVTLDIFKRRHLAHLRR